MRKKKENIKNWVIGILSAIVILLGLNTLKPPLQTGVVANNESPVYVVVTKIVFVEEKSAPTAKPTEIYIPPTEEPVLIPPTEEISIPSKSKSSDCLSAQEAWDHIGEIACVEYFVENPSRSSKGNIFLNEKSAYKTGFTVTIFSNSTSRFPYDPMSEFGNHKIQATGLIKMYQGHPEIIIETPNDIDIVD